MGAAQATLGPPDTSGKGRGANAAAEAAALRSMTAVDELRRLFGGDAIWVSVRRGMGPDWV